MKLCASTKVIDGIYHVEANSFNVIPDWGEIQLDCSLPNALTVVYSKDFRQPDHIQGDIDDRALFQMLLECKDQVCQII